MRSGTSISVAVWNAPPGRGEGSQQAPRCGRRLGLSLMEVILATAILLGSVIVLAELAGMGRDQAVRARRYSEAQRICEDTLAEIVLGQRPLTVVERQPLLAAVTQMTGREMTDRPSAGDVQDDGLFVTRNPEQQSQATASRWLHSIRTEPVAGLPGLNSVTVEVIEANPGAEGGIQFELTRWIRHDSSTSERIDPFFNDELTGMTGGGLLP